MAKKTRVTMIASVGADLVAGEEYVLEPEQADELIVKGYAKGKLSRRYSAEEKQELMGPTQTVRL
jgi:hypothetical protein